MHDEHQDPRFTNSATYQVSVTVTVAGGARSRTAHRRISKVAEQIANAAARSKDVVDAAAVYGIVSPGGETLLSRQVVFAAANTGHASFEDPTKLSRYLDPEHERALESKAHADGRYQRRRVADRDRRRTIGCADAYRMEALRQPWACGCVYCEPDFHLLVVDAPDDTLGEPRRCVCGRLASRCVEHTGVAIVVLDGDPDSLGELATRAATGGPGSRP